MLEPENTIREALQRLAPKKLLSAPVLQRTEEAGGGTRMYLGFFSVADCLSTFIRNNFPAPQVKTICPIFRGIRAPCCMVRTYLMSA